MEACASAHYWTREIAAFGHEVRMMPARYVKPYVKRNKNDAADAEAICEAVTRPSMRFVPVKTPEQQSILMLHRTRQLATAIIGIFERLDPALRRSATFDNDTAFARHALLRQALGLATFFCDAYASWQKGAVENINGRLRRDLPRKIDIDKLSDQELQDMLLMHNLTPRKCLAFKTPAQALLQQLGLNIKISFHRGVAIQS